MKPLIIGDYEIISVCGGWFINKKGTYEKILRRKKALTRAMNILPYTKNNILVEKSTKKDIRNLYKEIHKYESQKILTTEEVLEFVKNLIESNKVTPKEVIRNNEEFQEYINILC